MKRKTAKDEKINIKGALKKYTDFEDKIQNSLDITLSGKDNFHMIALVNGVKKIEEYTDSIIADTVKLVRINSEQGKPMPNAPFGEGPRKVLDTDLEMGEKAGFYIKDYGVGHLCSVNWGIKKGVMNIWSEFLPTVETPDVEPVPRNKMSEDISSDGKIYAQQSGILL
jgi:hypothetical protein